MVKQTNSKIAPSLQLKKILSSLNKQQLVKKSNKKKKTLHCSPKIMNSKWKSLGKKGRIIVMNVQVRSNWRQYALTHANSDVKVWIKSWYENFCLAPLPHFCFLPSLLSLPTTLSQISQQVLSTPSGIKTDFCHILLSCSPRSYFLHIHS